MKWKIGEAALVADLNTLIASTAFATWRQGQDLDVARWIASSVPS